jgi:hypothetical protein
MRAISNWFPAEQESQLTHTLLLTHAFIRHTSLVIWSSIADGLGLTTLEGGIKYSVQ